MEKKCSKCEIVKDYSDYHKCSRSKNGFKNLCKTCRSEEAKYYPQDKELRSKQNAAWYINNKNTVDARNLQYYINNKEAVLKQRAIKAASDPSYKQNKKLIYKRWIAKNLDKKKEYQAAYRVKNRRKLAKAYTLRIKNDLVFRLKAGLRSRLIHAIKNNHKAGSAVKDLGCSISELRTYLENLFQPGMTWSNWSRTGWHLDHIVPLHSFDLSDREQLLKACHYTNLQPLWAEDNIRKGSHT